MKASRHRRDWANVFGYVRSWNGQLFLDADFSLESPSLVSRAQSARTRGKKSREVHAPAGAPRQPEAHYIPLLPRRVTREVSRVRNSVPRLRNSVPQIGATSRCSSFRYVPELRRRERFTTAPVAATSTPFHKEENKSHSAILRGS